MNLEQCNKTLNAAVLDHHPIRIFAMFSGGNDSMVTTHFAMNHGAHEVLHINTGIGVQQTREFVRETCRQYGWPLREEHPPDRTYRDFVLAKGFPGPGAHRYAYSWLKERALRKVIRETKTTRKDRVMLITGVRNLESARRMGFVQPVLRTGATVWVAPMFAFSKIDLHEYRTEFSLPQSEVSKNLGMSGECLCGAFAKSGELERLMQLYPKAAQEILDLQEEAKIAGKPCVWGKPPNLSVFKDVSIDDPPLMPMCVGCWESKRKE